MNELIEGGRPSLLLFSHSAASDSLWPHGLQHARLPCLSLSPEVCSNSCASSWWCHQPSPPLLPLLLLPSIFPNIRVFPRSQLITSGGQSIGASALASVLPLNIHGWFPLGLTGLISLLYKGLSRVFSKTTIQKHQFPLLSLLYGPALTSVHIYAHGLLEKLQLWLYGPLSAK